MFLFVLSHCRICRSAHLEFLQQQLMRYLQLLQGRQSGMASIAVMLVERVEWDTRSNNCCRSALWAGFISRAQPQALA
jgi:hypothetical protein